MNFCVKRRCMTAPRYVQKSRGSTCDMMGWLWRHWFFPNHKPTSLRASCGASMRKSYWRGVIIQSTMSTSSQQFTLSYHTRNFFPIISSRAFFLSLIRCQFSLSNFRIMQFHGKIQFDGPVIFLLTHPCYTCITCHTMSCVPLNGYIFYILAHFDMFSVWHAAWQEI